MKSSAARGLAQVWGSIPIITLGLLLVTYALLDAPWPADPMMPGARLVSHLERLTGDVNPASAMSLPAPPEKTPGWYARRIMDGAVIGLLVLGYAALILAVAQGSGRALVALAIIGGTGVLYSASVGLYVGPILAIGGFSLMLFGAGLSWAAIRTQHSVTQMGSEHEPYSVTRS